MKIFQIGYGIICEAISKNVEWKRISNKKDCEKYDKVEPNFSSKIDLSKGEVYMAHLSNGLYLGFIQVTKDGFIENIIVSKSNRGRGYGNIFMEKCISLGAKKLWVKQINNVAQNLYNKYGFEITGETNHGYYHGYFMERIEK